MIFFFNIKQKIKNSKISNNNNNKAKNKNKMNE